MKVNGTFDIPWDKDSRIVIGIHIGTTHSVVAYTWLERGLTPLIYKVGPWPGEHFHSADNKVPTLVYYDLNGKAVAFGAEAATRKARREADVHKWQLARDFKSCVHPLSPRLKHGSKVLMPDNVSPRTIYSDFLGYLIKHTKSHFEVMIANGKWIWGKYHSDMTIVITHSNGWGAVERPFLQQVAVDTGLSTPTDVTPGVYFVSEAEATVHYCIHETNLQNCLEVGEKIILCNAGDSMSETTLYTICEKGPRIQLSDVQGYLRTQTGATHVKDEAEQYLRRFFENPEARLTKNEINEYVSRGVEDFEMVAKKQFRLEAGEEEVTIKFAGDNFWNEELGVVFGEVVLQSENVRSFFEPCVTAIIRSIESVAPSSKISYIALVGELGGNTYIQNRIKEHFDGAGCRLVVTRECSDILAVGAVVWHHVSHRLAL